MPPFVFAGGASPSPTEYGGIEDFAFYSTFYILYLIYRWHFAQRKAAFIERFSCFAQWTKICNKFLVNLPKNCAFFVDKASFIYYN